MVIYVAEESSFGDVVRITGTGQIYANLNDPMLAASVTFKLWLDDEDIGAIAFPLPNTAENVIPIFFEFLLTYRYIDDENLVVQGNGMVMTCGDWQENQSIGPVTTDVLPDVNHTCDITAVLDPTSTELTIVFDQATVEYLNVPDSD